MKGQFTYTHAQTLWLVILRLLIGWHFLYEGLIKILNPSWTAFPYLMDSQGFFAEYFYSIAGNPSLLAVSNFINIYGLTLVGLGLILGCFSRIATVGGIVFLALYYLSHPPFIGAEYMMPTEGSYLWVDKNLIEIGALMVLFYFPTSRIIGLDRYISKVFNRK
ncbi:thiosulfate dehydrogenase [quinone] large subunit [Dysgonomonas sp. PFB1-18]|uniref:DoxX family protein n=1 Tax=unclassified Dysgonomonas TaxID=2630389 RepID=UPI0024745470|nr:MULTISPECIES: DoxX family protein [unclassified Dysgonomonas]MDH6308936.1 thiosulfate dehydrogenase [quinone] large subunit [Dysgonomonas sp. PF1-14]MDH6338687.1 thiosulfate dehydrogenase [quinone] large subunit [Dysgonomonas sp. PF1-16]MDH6380285.1 thiosulfate dehydrogenase [quinone] large subunit [Dysgonomonas sp. PFB1-18]MDH6397615.1 thiosulfate dehydrogenase [quinone] large subunit [Dysgonomonas sp. PF1-23]